MRNSPMPRLPAFLVVTTLLTSPAYAFDAASFTDKFKGLLGSAGVNMNYGSQEPSGSSGVLLKDVEILYNFAPAPVKISSLRIEGIEFDRLESLRSDFAANVSQPQVSRLDHASLSHYDCAVDDVSQLANIAWPAIGQQLGTCTVGQY